MPVAPFLPGAGSRALALAVALASVALLVVGATSARLTGQSALRGALRLLAIGGGAGVIAYSIGTLLGVTV